MQLLLKSCTLPAALTVLNPGALQEKVPLKAGLLRGTAVLEVQPHAQLCRQQALAASKLQPEDRAQSRQRGAMNAPQAPGAEDKSHLSAASRPSKCIVLPGLSHPAKPFPPPGEVLCQAELLHGTALPVRCTGCF